MQNSHQRRSPWNPHGSNLPLSHDSIIPIGNPRAGVTSLGWTKTGLDQTVSGGNVESDVKPGC
jgi:hypothetical protein